MSDQPLSDIRDRCLDLLAIREEWRFTSKALSDGYQLGFTELRMIDLIVDLLREGRKLHEIHLGDPPGSGGKGYELRTGRTSSESGLYIKIKLEWHYALIMSFKQNREI